MTTNRNYSLPDSVLDCFRQFRGDTDSAYWGLGDAVDSAVVELAGKTTQRQIYKAAAIETDYSISEVRMLHETSRGTDTKLRDEFAPPLVHSHYRVLRYIDDRGVKHGYLKLCVESADAYGGRPMPAAILAKRVRKDMGLEPPDPTVGEILERAVAVLDKALALDPKAVCRELSRYVERMSADPAAGQAKGELAFSASELLEAAKAWGKDATAHN